jgi:hypothetical protein
LWCCAGVEPAAMVGSNGHETICTAGKHLRADGRPGIKAPAPEWVVTPLICEVCKVSVEVQDECHEYQTALCPTPECAAPHVVRHGTLKGRQRYHCKKVVGPGSARPTAHADVSAAHTSPRGGPRASSGEMRRGSLRAAEEITGHKKYETIGRWLRLAAEHAEVLSAKCWSMISSSPHWRWMSSGRL